MFRVLSSNIFANVFRTDSGDIYGKKVDTLVLSHIEQNKANNRNFELPLTQLGTQHNGI